MAFAVCVHQDTREVGVRFVMHVKVTLVSMEEHVNLSMAMMAISAHVLLVSQVHDVKYVSELRSILVV